MQNFILKSYFYFLDKIQIGNFKETDKKIGDYRKSHLKYTLATPEKLKLVEEYNQVLRESQEKLKQLTDKIFE